MALGAAEDTVRAPDLVTREGEDDAAAPRRVHCGARHVELAARAHRADRRRARRPPQHRGGGPARRASRSTSPSTTPARGRRRSTPDGAGRVRAVHGRARAAVPTLRRHHRGQRAEPEPLLAAAVRPRRLERLGARVPPAPRAARTTRSRRSTRRSASGAARSRRAAPTGPEGIRPTSSPTAFIQALGAAYRASGRTLPVMDGLRVPPVPGQLVAEPGLPAPALDHDRPRRLRQARRPARPGVRRHGAAGLRRCRSSTTSSGSSRSFPDGKRSLYSGTEPTTTKPVDESQQAAAYDLGLRLAFCQPTVVGMLLFHSHDEEALVELAVGRLLRRRHAEGELLGRARRARPHARRVDRALRRPRARRRAHATSASPGRASSSAGKRDTRFRCTLRLRLGGHRDADDDRRRRSAASAATAAGAGRSSRR